MKHIQRVISFLLAMMMVVGMMPLTVVHAEETEATETTVVETAESENEETVSVEESEPFAEISTESVEPAQTIPETTNVTVPAEETTVPTEAPTETVTEPVQTDPEATEATSPKETEIMVTEALEEITASAEAADLLASGRCGKDVYWDLESGGTLTIYGSGDMDDYPSFWDDFRYEISNVVIEDGVTSIGKNAFQSCTSLTSIIIPESVNTIGKYAFALCENLARVSIPDGVVNIEEGVFADCSGLTSVFIPSSVTNIGDFAFSGCINLISVDIPDSVTSMGEAAFIECSSLISVTIPKGVTSIGDLGFYNCSSLRDVVISEGVTGIGNNAFASCQSLERIELPDSMTFIGDHAFFNCKKISTISIPDSVSEIGENAFWACDSLTSIVLPAGITAIKPYTLSMCDNLRNVVIPEGVTVIGDYAFTGSGLTDIIFPESVTYIGEYAFYGCHNLTDITLSQGVSEIGIGAFGGFNLTAIYVDDQNENFCDLNGVLFSKDKTVLVNYPVARKGSYEIPKGTLVIAEAAFSGSSVTAVTIPEGVLDIGNMGFSYCGWLSSITIPTSVTSIGESAFVECEELRKIVFQGSAPTIGENAFSNVKASVWYMGNDPTWTEEVRQNYGGTLSWKLHGCTNGHTVKVDAAVEPNCISSGLTEGAHCAECGVIIIAQNVLPALGHNEVINPAVAPTCTRSGLTEGKYCDRCREVLVKRELLPAEGHWYEEGFCQTCGGEDKGDHSVFGGKSLSLKVIDPETGKAYTSKQIKWSLAEEYAPYVTVTAAGKLTAKKVVEKVRIEAIGNIAGAEEVQVILTADIYPAVTQVEIFNGMEMVNGKTVPVDTSEEVILPDLTAKVYPTDAMADVTWKSSSRKIAEIDPVTGELTWKGRNGTVTITATAKDGSKKKATVKLTFGTLAEGLTIGIKDKKQIIAAEEADVISGKSFQLAAELTGSPTNRKVTWSLENTADSAYVKLSSGKVTAKTVYEERTVVIRATAADGSGMTDTFTVNVKPKDAGILILKQDGKNVTKSTVYADRNKGGTVELTAHNLTGGETPDVEWRSSRTAIATVANGVVTFLKAGTVTITATDVNDGRKAAVTVKAVQLASKVTITGAAEVASGKSITLKADCEDGASSKVIWTIVKGAEYAKLSSKGKLTANKDITSAKEVTVRATAADGSGVESEPVTVTIRPLAQGVQIYSEEGGRTLFSVRSSESLWVRSNTILEWAKNECGSLQLSARVYPYYHNEPSRNAIQDVDWKSSSSKIASVDEDGLVTCHKAGTVTITATAGDGSGRKVSFKLKVINKIESLSMEDQRVKGGKSIDLAKKLEIDPTGATYKTFDWEIIGGNGAAYASINAKGVLKAKKVTGLMDVEVRATAQDGSGKSAEFTVTITP